MTTYTPQMLDALRKASPIDIDKAANLASDFGLPRRSVIAKAVSMKDVDYVAKPKSKGKKADVTKADLIQMIRDQLSLAPRSGDLTKDDLRKIVASFDASIQAA